MFNLYIFRQLNLYPDIIKKHVYPYLIYWHLLWMTALVRMGKGFGKLFCGLIVRLWPRCTTALLVSVFLASRYKTRNSKALKPTF